MSHSSMPAFAADFQGEEQADLAPLDATVLDNPALTGIALQPLQENLSVASYRLENGAVIADPVRTEPDRPSGDLPAAEPNNGRADEPFARIVRDMTPERLATFKDQPSPAQQDNPGREAGTVAARPLPIRDASAHRNDTSAPSSRAQHADLLPISDETRPDSPTTLSPSDWQPVSATQEWSPQEQTDRHNSHEDRSAPPLTQVASAPPGSDHGTGSPAIASPIAGEMGRTIARAPEIQNAPPTVPAQPVALADRTREGMPSLPLRSVTFEVTQPDLGRVNVRVAVTHDVVHAHIASDRPEVGQFLMNGQDRLQSALQNSGLDLGQFRVDIERQSPGRSFQQGHQQGQHEPSGQDSGRPQHDQPRIVHDNGVLRHRGSLNLVA